MHDHPVGVVVSDDLRRSRLTVFFRLPLAIPHLIWLGLWSALVLVLAVLAWVLTLVQGRLPAWLHRLFCNYVRYVAHVAGYLGLVGNPYPDFTGAGQAYPVDLRLPAEPEDQRRWSTLVRLVLAIPALLVAAAIGGVAFGSTTKAGNGKTSTGLQSAGLAFASALLGWFACVATGRMPRGLRDAGAYTIGYRSQTLAYVLLLTPRYPNADPLAMLAGVEHPPAHPVRVVADPDLRRSRVTVLFRLALAVPHLFWLILWSAVALLAAIVQWVVTLVRGRPAERLSTFLCRYVRYSFHVIAFLSLAANPFPGFGGRAGMYPVDVELPAAARQNRWKTAFRIILAVPAVSISSALGGALAVDAILTWFVALAKGSAPEGLRNLSIYALRYSAQLNAYIFLVTDAYPHASPLQDAEAAPEDEPAVDAAAAA